MQETAGPGDDLVAPSAIDEEPNLAEGDFREAVLHGFGLTPKRIGSKWLYDAEGSRLFEQVTGSEGYYLTRAECEILATCCGQLGAMLGPDASLVEFGSGSSSKVRLLLDALPPLRCYVPVEISESQLQLAVDSLSQDYPDLPVLPMALDYMTPFELPPAVRAGRVLGFFPGSTLCNLRPENAVALLRRLGRIMGPDSLFLAGVDLKKDVATLLRAYNDPQGPIWHFNLNVLARMNRELGGTFDRAAFRHEARYDREAGRIEAAILPTRDQQVSVAGQRFRLAGGERIVLEHSYKYRIDEFQALARKAGWARLRAWTDRHNLFSVHLLAYRPG